MPFEQQRDHSAEVEEFLAKQRENEAREQRRLQDNEKAKDRMKNLRHERSMEGAEAEGILSGDKVCMIHNDLPAAFALQHADVLKGLPQRINLCIGCARKLKVNTFASPRGECVVEDFHSQRPRMPRKAFAELEHNGLFGEVGPIPLCKNCSGKFAIQLRPLTEEAAELEALVPMLNREATLKALMKIANSLDEKGLYEEANEVDAIISVFAAEYQGKKVKLNDPIRNPAGSKKKFRVYVKDPKTKNVKKVQFGDPKMEIKRDDSKSRKNFRSRHQCDSPAAKDKTKAKYWSCFQWRKNKKVDN